MKARKPAGALALALLLALAARAQTPRAVPPPLPAPAAPTAADALSLMQSAGKPVVDISRLGALPGPGAAARSTRKAIQSALDAFRLPGVPAGRATIYVPTGNYQVDRWVSPPAATSGVTIAGEGGSSSIAPWGGGHSPLLLGLPFTPAPNRRSMDSGQFFPLDGTMDSTVKGRFGYRTSPGGGVNGFATAWDTPLDLGPVQGWGVVKCLTVEFCIDADKTPIGRAHIAGMSRGPVAGPWIVIGAPGRIDLLTTLDGEAVSRRLSIPYKDKGDRRRVVFQRNFATGKDLVAIDGVRLTPAGDAVPAGSKLADNLDLPFHIGASGMSGVQRSDYFQGNPTTDLAVCGLRVSTAPRYVDSTPAGQPIARLDGKPVTDAGSYFEPATPDTLGYLNVTDDVEDLASCRFIPFRGASAQTFACYAMDPDHGNNASTIGSVSLQGLALRTAGVGSALTIGAAIDARISGCLLEGARGIGSVSGLVNYTTRIVDTTLNGTVGGARFVSGSAILDSPRFDRVGRDGCLSARGSGVTVRDAPLNAAHYAGGCTPRSYFRTAGGSLVAENVGVDNEEGISPVVATYWITATYGDATSQAAYLKLDRSGSNTHKGIPLVRLDRESPNAPLATARITDPMMGAADAVVCIINGGWNVRLDDPGDRRGMPGVLDLSVPGPPAPGQPVGTVSVAR
jgi:hypothetical protein